MGSPDGPFVPRKNRVDEGWPGRHIQHQIKKVKIDLRRNEPWFCLILTQQLETKTFVPWTFIAVELRRDGRCLVTSKLC